jgi:hypothetical protein
VNKLDTVPNPTVFIGIQSGRSEALASLDLEASAAIRTDMDFLWQVITSCGAFNSAYGVRVSFCFLFWRCAGRRLEGLPYQMVSILKRTQCTDGSQEDEVGRYIMDALAQTRRHRERVGEVRSNDFEVESTVAGRLSVPMLATPEKRTLSEQEPWYQG